MLPPWEPSSVPCPTACALFVLGMCVLEEQGDLWLCSVVCESVSQLAGEALKDMAQSESPQCPAWGTYSAGVPTLSK